MDDTIYREAAVKHLKHRLYETATNNPDIAGVFSEIADNRVETWIEELPSAQQRWIPVTERLPEDTQNIIVTRSDDGMTDFGQYNAKKNWCVNDGYWPNAFDFVAWMPLPEPYGEDGES